MMTFGLRWKRRSPLAGFASALALLGAVPAQANADTPCTSPISNADRAVAINAVQNLMGRYSHLIFLKGESHLGSLFALKTEGVSWKTPGGPVGIDRVKLRLANPDEKAEPGLLRMHSMFTPVIEIAGNGKTAKGVWDSFGPNVNSPDEVGGWLWLKYAVDFVKEDGEWKIWHLQLYPIFNTPYDKSITQSAKERRERAKLPSPPRSKPTTLLGQMLQENRPPDLQAYDGVSAIKGPFIPEPYCEFDPKTAY